MGKYECVYLQTGGLDYVRYRPFADRSLSKEKEEIHEVKVRERERNAFCVAPRGEGGREKREEREREMKRA